MPQSCRAASIEVGGDMRMAKRAYGKCWKIVEKKANYE
jgi:hypothetical protein